MPRRKAPTVTPSNEVYLAKARSAQRRQSIRKSIDAEEYFSTSGSTGLARFSGHIDEEWHQKLKGIQGVRAWREMRDNDSVIGNAAHLIESMIRQTRWQVVPSEEGGEESERWAVFVDECLSDMSHTFHEFISEVLSMLWFGWAYFEKVYKVRGGPDAEDPRFRSRYSDNLIGWRKIAIRSQETLDCWQFDDDGGIQGMWQIAAPDYRRVFIPIEKAILFRTQIHKNNPEGRSLLRNGWRSWSFLKRLQEIEAIGIERDLVGLPVIHLPAAYMDAGATADKQQARNEFATLLQQIRRNEHEGVLFPAEVNDDGTPSGFKLQLLTSGGSRQIDVGETIKRYQRDIAMTLMTQFSFLGMDQVGSFSLSSDQTSMFSTALGSILDNIEETFHRFATVELMKLNGVPPEYHPKLKHGDLEKEDVVRFSEMISQLVANGIISADSNLEDFTREKLGLPARPDDLDDYTDPTMAIPPGESRPYDWGSARPRPSMQTEEIDATAAEDEKLAATLNELTLAMERLARVGDLAGLNTTRRAYAAALGVNYQGDLTGLPGKIGNV